MSLDCGHSPLWVWYVGKCQTFERASLQTVCLFETSSWGWDQWFLLLPFWNVSSGILPLSFLKYANSWDRRVWKTDWVKSLRSTQVFKYEFSHESPLHCVFSEAVLGEAMRAWSFKYTKESSVKEGSKSGCYKIRFQPSFEKQNCTDRDLHLSREDKSPKWVSKLEQENRHWKYLQ